MKITEFSAFGRIAADDGLVRVSLNKWAGSRDAGGFSEMLDVADLGYACHCSPKRKSFRCGMTNLVFVKVADNRFLFAAALDITSDPGPDGFCPYADATERLWLTEYAKRLVVSDSKPSKCKMGAWTFRAGRLEDLIVESYGKTEWSKLKWEGYDRVHLSFGMLYDVIEGNRHADYRAHLEDVCGVYALKDSATGKLYVGSAYGKAGVAQRWNHYLESLHGGNLLLKRLYDEKGSDYFRENFTFDLIREFPLGTKPETVIAFESKMKALLGTRDGGYNAN